MKFLIASDLHLSTHIWKHRPIYHDSLYAWKQIVDIAISCEVDVVILAGDLLDKQTNTSEPIAWFIKGLHELYDAKIDVWYTQGQHEMQSRPWASISDTAVHLHMQQEEAEDLVFAGCDFCQEKELQEFLTNEPALNADVLIMHQVWLEFMGEECKPQGSFSDIPDNVQILITGDYHEHLVTDYEIRGRKLTVLSPGSTHLRSIAEPEDKYVFLMDSSRKPSIKSLPLASRRVLRLDVSSKPELKAAKKAIEGFLSLAEDYAEENKMPEAVRKPLVHITYNKEDSELASKLDATFNDKAHLFYKVVRSYQEEELQPNMSSYVDAEDRVSMLGVLDNYVDEMREPGAHLLAKTLLQSNEPLLSLHKWVKDQMHEN